MNPDQMPQINIPPRQDIKPFDEDQVLMNDKALQELMMQQQGPQSKRLQGCLLFLGILAILILFFIFGNRVFEFFHLDNVYHFILSVLIIITLYVIGMTIGALFIRYPKDLLTILLDRIRA